MKAFRKFCSQSPTLAQAVSVSQGMEAAAQKSKELHEKGSQRSLVLVVNSQSRHAPSTPGRSPPCGRCGRGNHDHGSCRFRTATCHKCGRWGTSRPRVARRGVWTDLGVTHKAS